MCFRQGQERACALARGTGVAVEQIKRALRRPILEVMGRRRGPEELKSWLDVWFSARPRSGSRKWCRGLQGEREQHPVQKSPRAFFSA